MLTPDSDKQDAIARLSRLAEHGLDKMKSLSFCTFPMKGTKGLFEVRKNGVRFYGGRIRGGQGSEILVLLGAEQKAGKKEASPALLKRCEAELQRIKKAYDAELERAAQAAARGG